MGEIRICVKVCMYVAFVVVAAITIAAQRDEHGKKCPGPLAYYDALGCKAEYEMGGDFCPKRYNCDHLRKRSKNKCYINYNRYDIDQYLKEEDANRCDFMCVCKPAIFINDIAAFECEDFTCPEKTAKKNCYLRKDPSKCCGDPEEICPDTPQDRPICLINNVKYKDGEHFEIEGEPDTICICRPGYDGRKIPPFCYRPNHLTCNHPVFNHVDHFDKKCAPIFLNTAFNQNTCYIHMRCQNDYDMVIIKNTNLKMAENPDDKYVCHFGNLIMQIGDKLMPNTDDAFVCVECICEIPPVPTCQYLSEKICYSRQ